MNLVKWILNPVGWATLQLSGGGGGGGSGAEEEERRKDELRRRIDAMYGIAPSVPAQVEKVPSRGIRSSVADMEAEAQQPADAASAELAAQAASAKSGMEAENTKLADATRAYYTDQLGRQYQDAERNTRFKLARQGLLGGTEDVFQMGRVKEDRDTGATRVDEAVRRAIADLVSQREQERLNAINLVNSGAGDSAVSSAQAGLRNAFERQSSAQRANIFGDLFQNAADAATAGNLMNRDAAFANLVRNKIATFYPTSGSSSGSITPNR